MALAEIIFGQVFDRVLDIVSKQSVPVAAGKEVEVAKAITKELAPVVVNATNSEPWHQSRIFRGLLTAALGWVGSKAGLMLTEGELAEAVTIVAALIEAGGLGYAWYGRVVGSSKKPVGQ